MIQDLWYSQGYKRIMKTFSERVVQAALDIPFGRVASYGDIARVCGGGGQAARSISGILGRAYKNGEKNVPFHRIVYSNGRVWLSGNYNHERTRRFKQEGIIVNSKGYIENFENIRYEF